MAATAADIRNIINQSTIGTEQWFKHGLVRSFLYSSGVREVAQVGGAYWFLDKLATFFAPKLKSLAAADEANAAQIIFTSFPNKKGTISMYTESRETPVLEEELTYQDFPEGTWHFQLGVHEIDEGQIVACALDAEG